MINCQYSPFDHYCSYALEMAEGYNNTVIRLKDIEWLFKNCILDERGSVKTEPVHILIESSANGLQLSPPVADLSKGFIDLLRFLLKLNGSQIFSDDFGSCKHCIGFLLNFETHTRLSACLHEGIC